MNYTIMSMDGVLGMSLSSLLASKFHTIYIPLYTRYSGVKITLEEFRYHVPVNPLQIAGAMLIHERSLNRPTLLLLSFFNPLFHALNPKVVKTPFAVIISPKRNEIVNSTEILVREKEPASHVKFILKLRSKIVFQLI